MREPPTPPPVDAERRGRLTAWMAEAGLSAVLSRDPATVLLLSGLSPVLGGTVAVLTREGELFASAPGNEPPERVREPDADLRPGGNDPNEALAHLLERAGGRLHGGRVGVVGSSANAAPAGVAAEAGVLPPGRGFLFGLVEGLGGVPVDASAGVRRQMLLKTPAEVERIGAAQAVASAAVDAFSAGVGRAAAGEPLTEARLAGEVEAAARACSGRGGVADARAWAWVQAGENAPLAGTVSRAGGGPVRGFAVLELAVCADGFWADLTRTAVVGGADGPRAGLLDAVRAAHAAAVDALRPGVPHAAVHAAARDALAAAGLADAFPHATGHPTGFRYHDAGPALDAGSEAPVEAGMVLTVEPGVYGRDLPAAGFAGPFGCRHEENYLVTDSGCRRLSTAAATDA